MSIHVDDLTILLRNMLSFGNGSPEDVRDRDVDDNVVLEVLTLQSLRKVEVPLSDLEVIEER